MNGVSVICSGKKKKVDVFITFFYWEREEGREIEIASNTMKLHLSSNNFSSHVSLANKPPTFWGHRHRGHIKRFKWRAKNHYSLWLAHLKKYSIPGKILSLISYITSTQQLFITYFMRASVIEWVKNPQSGKTITASVDCQFNHI